MTPPQEAGGPVSSNTRGAASAAHQLALLRENSMTSGTFSKATAPHKHDPLAMMPPRSPLGQSGCFRVTSQRFGLFLARGFAVRVVP